ncbi:MAG: DUF4432 family protein [Bacteroidales bacterium]|nr:DUF4432 family protein [Bacteroidales bacterium]
MEHQVFFIIKCRDISLNEETKFKAGDFSIEVIHRENEPANALRIKVERGNLRVELLPSKGLSVGEAFINGYPVFWEPPTDLIDPDMLDLDSREILVNGKETDGFTFLKTFMGGIEFYGMKNWGMPRVDEKTGELFLLHGETSNIPVEEISVTLYGDRLELAGKFIYRNFDFTPGKTWYLSGEPLYEITNTVVLSGKEPAIRYITHARNISGQKLEPDWGYHVTPRPEDGSRLIIPSKSVEDRNGALVPGDYEIWHPAKNPGIRTETGIIHKGLKLYRENNKTFSKCLVVYPSGRGISVSFPPSPYFQTWFCNGGANSKEFSYAASGEPVFRKNWDAQGIEPGSSALDHNGKIDRNVEYKKFLAPGEFFENEVTVEMLSEEQTTTICHDMEEYNQSRTIKG